jgi:hypothetical protein
VKECSRSPRPPTRSNLDPSASLSAIHGAARKQRFHSGRASRGRLAPRQPVRVWPERGFIIRDVTNVNAEAGYRGLRRGVCSGIGECLTGIVKGGRVVITRSARGTACFSNSSPLPNTSGPYRLAGISQRKQHADSPDLPGLLCPARERHSEHSQHGAAQECAPVDRWETGTAHLPQEARPGPGLGQECCRVKHGEAG